MSKINLALDKLKTDLINNISIINFINNNKIFSVDVIGNSILVKGESDRKWVYICCPDKDRLNILKRYLDADDINFAAVDEWMYPVLTEGKKTEWELTAIQFYLPEDVLPQPSEFETVSLTKGDAEIVYENSDYKKYISLEYVTDRIVNGISAGIYVNDNLVSWAITQDDGAIGFLHALDDYRNKGYGFSVMLSMIEKLREGGQLPFAYAEKDNEKSLNLLLKLGFRKNKSVRWFEIK